MCVCVCVQDTARRIAKVSVEAKLKVEEDEYVEGFKPHMMDVVHAWCKGATFAQICRMTDIFEGQSVYPSHTHSPRALTAHLFKESRLKNLLISS